MSEADATPEPHAEPPLVLVTGATDGIGKETAFQMARLGARVVVHGRSPDRVRAAAEDLRTRAGASWVGEAVADFSSLPSVRAMAQTLLAQHPRLDVLINNAGAYVRRRTITADGYESTLQINHLAPFLLTHLLLPALHASPAGRIVNVSSIAHLRAKMQWHDLHGELEYDDYDAYAQSKMANVLFTTELARRLGRRHPTVNALHPGVVGTKLLREGFEMDGPDSLTKGAATSVYLALSPEVAGVTGRYFVDCRPSRMHPLAGDPGTSSRLYAISAQLVGITGLRKPEPVAA